MADLTTPINIEVINKTANDKQAYIALLIMKNVYKVFKDLSPELNVQSTRPLYTFKEDEILQPYDANLAESKKLGVISKRTLSVDLGMIYISDEIERYRNTFMHFIEMKDYTSAKLPFAIWYLTVITKIGLKDLYKLPWQGVKSSGTTTKDITDGYLKIIADEITANNISTDKGNLYTVSGADYTEESIITELKNQFALFPQETQEEGVTIFIPYRYKQMYKECFKTEYDNVTDGDVPTSYLDGTDKKAKFVWTSAIGTSKRVTMVAPKVLKYGTNRKGEEFGKIVVFHPGAKPTLIAAFNKIVIGFQIRTLDNRAFNTNNLA